MAETPTIEPSSPPFNPPPMESFGVLLQLRPQQKNIDQLHCFLVFFRSAQVFTSGNAVLKAEAHPH